MSAPQGPRIKPIIHFDQDGQYTVFTGKTCSVCGLALTSRNRYETALLCLEHGKEKERARVRQPRTRGETNKRHGPEWMRLHALFNAWATHPTEHSVYLTLRGAMREHEMKQRLSSLLPPPEPQTSLPTA
jgi:hypothetical protein